MKFDTMTNRDVVVELCRRIRARRIELRLSQESLAAAAGIGIATLKRIEGGQAPNLVTLVAIVRGLGGVAQLESLLFSAPSEDSSHLEDDALPLRRIRARARPVPQSAPERKPREIEQDYLFSALNHVDWHRGVGEGELPPSEDGE